MRPKLLLACSIQQAPSQKLKSTSLKTLVSVFMSLAPKNINQVKVCQFLKVYQTTKSAMVCFQGTTKFYPLAKQFVQKKLFEIHTSPLKKLIALNGQAKGMLIIGKYFLFPIHLHVLIVEYYCVICFLIDRANSHFAFYSCHLLINFRS